MDYLACESNAFHFDMEDATVALYDEGGASKQACKQQIVERLVTLCATLNEYPHARPAINVALRSICFLDASPVYIS